MIEGGSSRNYIEAKRMMYAPTAPPGRSSWRSSSTSPHRLRPATSRSRRRRHPGLRLLGRRALRRRTTANTASPPPPNSSAHPRLGVPVIYFGVDTASLLPTFRETGADVIGLDWRIPLDEGWRAVGHRPRRPGQPRPHRPLRARRRSPRPGPFLYREQRPAHSKGERFDPLGAGLLAVALGSLTLGLSFGQEWGWFSSGTLASVGVGIVMLGVAIYVEKHIKHPILDLHLVTNHVFAFANISFILCMMPFSMAPSTAILL